MSSEGEPVEAIHALRSDLLEYHRATQRDHTRIAAALESGFEALIDLCTSKQRTRDEKQPRKMVDKVMPQPDRDEESVIDALAVNGLGVHGFTVIKYDGAIRVTPPRDITQTQWDSYNHVLEMKQATWNHEYKHWKIPL